MENYSSMNPLLMSQSPSIDALKNIQQQKGEQKGSEKDLAALKKAAQDFESVLINFTLKAMWDAVPKGSLSEDEDCGMDTYTDIMQSSLSQDIAAKGGFGIATVLYNQLVREKGLIQKDIAPASLVKENGRTNQTGGVKKAYGISIKRDCEEQNETAG
ncbi:MAG TPA: rod-binding protein [Candidatus Brocadiaceae bacterium]|nr:rod-binding protein [Candidatus Brocadiaceae bacterium]